MSTVVFGDRRGVWGYTESAKRICLLILSFNTESRTCRGSKSYLTLLILRIHGLVAASHTSDAAAEYSEAPAEDLETLAEHSDAAAEYLETLAEYLETLAESSDGLAESLDAAAQYSEIRRVHSAKLMHRLHSCLDIWCHKRCIAAGHDLGKLAPFW